ncbi:MAG TPA: adenylate kinase [Gammaproteobacteria bacterium]|jgi:adenylate kinase|nr:adenylate kinase [Gammaproteobacteria bacterium]HIK72350.1 adenylate kinase [Gammaproteobacteria bacterium]
MKIILLGPPGAGKGTQADVICKTFSIPHISTGNMLREAAEAKTDLGKKAQALLDAGILVSDEVIVGLVEQRINQQDCQSGFLFDGFPRTIPQAEALIERSVEIDFVVEIEVPDEEIISRMSGRRMHPGSGRNYHIEFNPPKIADIDDESGEPLVQREDDNPETVKDRLEVYSNQTLPLIEFYSERSESVKYIRVSGSESPELVSKNILDQIDQA